MSSLVECPNRPQCLACAARKWESDPGGIHGETKCDPSEFERPSRTGRYRPERPLNCPLNTASCSGHSYTAEAILKNQLRNMSTHFKGQ